MRKFVFVAGLLAAPASPLLSEPVSFPVDHPYESVRGLTVDDGAKGVAIVEGNKYYEKGQRFTHVNKQEVKTAREFSLLVAAAVESGKLSLTSQSDPVAEKSDRPPIPPKEWARALAFSDTPDGVVIEYSPNPEQIGGIFEKFNGEIVTSAADLKAKLDHFIAAPPAGFSTSILTYGEKPSLDQLRADAITEALPRIPYSPPLDSRRSLFLDKAIGNEPPRPTAADTAKYFETWGPLAKLAGKFFIGDIFKDTCEKAHSGNSCYVMFWWQQPGQVLTRAWYADRGYLVAADTIVPTGRPGLFMVYRWGPNGSNTVEFSETGNHFLRVTKSTTTEKGLKLDFREGATMAGTPSDDPMAYSLSGMSNGHYESIQSYSRSAALDNSKGLRDSIQRAINADREAERQRERDETMSAMYGALNSIGQAMDAQNRAQQAQFEQQMRDGGSSYSGGSSYGDSSPGRAIIMESLSNPMDGTPPQTPPKTASEAPYVPGTRSNSPIPGQSGSTCKYWHRLDERGEYRQSAPGEEGSTCGDSVSVSRQ